MEHAFAPWVVPWQVTAAESEEPRDKSPAAGIEPNASPPPAEKAEHKPKEFPEYFLG